MKLLEIANVGAEWVLWVLIALSIFSVAIMLERIVFFIRHRFDHVQGSNELMRFLSRGEYSRAAGYFRSMTSMEAKVITVGLEQHEMGPAATGELMSGALTGQKARYDRYLSVLASVGSNAPFIGLFGTVLGIIQAFGAFDLKSGNVDGIMYAISEALVATGVGLLVAIPAVIGYNLLKGRVKKSVGGTDQIVRVLTAHLTAQAEGYSTAIKSEKHVQEQGEAPSSASSSSPAVEV